MPQTFLPCRFPPLRALMMANRFCCRGTLTSPLSPSSLFNAQSLVSIGVNLFDYALPYGRNYAAGTVCRASILLQSAYLLTSIRHHPRHQKLLCPGGMSVCVRVCVCCPSSNRCQAMRSLCVVATINAISSGDTHKWHKLEGLLSTCEGVTVRDTNLENR